MLLHDPAPDLATHRARGGYRAVSGEVTPEDVRAEVAAAGVLGRGGAWFPLER
jgi:hypothetical protein